VLIRLRTNAGDFLPFNNCMGTMLHELVHNEFGSHSAKFYERLDELWTEFEQGTSSGSSFGSTLGPSVAPVPAFQGKGQVLGGKRAVTDAEKRQLAAAAAANRLGLSRDGRALGGKESQLNSLRPGRLSVRDRVRVATEARLRKESPCVAVFDGHDLEDDLVHVEENDHSVYGWACERCTLHNPSSALLCEVCGVSRQGSDAEEEGWMCGVCTLINSRTLLKCAACSNPAMFCSPHQAETSRQFYLGSSSSSSSSSRSGGGLVVDLSKDD